MRPPRRIQELQGRIASARDGLSQRLGRSPRPGEIADLLGEDLDQVIEALSTDGCFHPDSLDRSVPDSFTTVGDSLSGESHDLSSADARLVLGPLIRRLNDRDRRILDLRFFHDATQQEIADDIGVTQMHVSRLINRILAELRSELDETVRDDSEADEQRVTTDGLLSVEVGKETGCRTIPASRCSDPPRTWLRCSDPVTSTTRSSR